MKNTFYRITAALTIAAIAGMITACGSAGVPMPEVTDIHTDPDKILETTYAAETPAADESTQSSGQSGLVPDISIPDGTIPDVTISDVHIDMPDLSVPDINEYFSDTKETVSQSSADSSADEQTITDVNGAYSYTGTLFQGGNDTNGYLKIPTGFVDFVDVNSTGRLTQYSDATRNNIFTLTHYDGIDYQTAAEKLRSYKAEQSDVKDIKSAAVTIADYRAVQLYAHHDDGIDVVNWFIEDPADPDKSTYYVAMEFDTEHQYMLACSSTFQTTADHNRS